MDSIIGKLYVPIDNSYQVCLFDLKCHRLAGTAWLPAVFVEVVSEPYESLTRSVTGMTITHTFILVKDANGYLHHTMFHEKALRDSGAVGELDPDFKEMNYDHYRF